MRKGGLYKNITIVISSILLLVIFFVKCINSDEDKKISVRNAKGQEYAGTETCRSCHQATYDSFLTTAHHLSSAIALEGNVRGSFDNGRDIYIYDSARKVVLQKGSDGYYQVAFVNGKEERKERMDIVIGSGKRGQSYLYWKHGGLRQLPVSYFTKLDTWVNSPGFTTKNIYFDRMIEARCLECHVTNATGRFQDEYDPNQLMLGIDCEKCHGPAKEHVDFHMANKQEANGKYIINTGRLTRQQQLDACAICHSGTMLGFTNPFSFKPGDTLSKHFNTNALRVDSVNLDVHANQYGLLASSRCFIESKTMQCGTCHDLHKKESGNLMAYTQKCLSCHSPEGDHFCTLKADRSVLISEQCINCHMPVRESRNITLLTSGKAIPSAQPVRTHLIKVYK
jgi:hypothetical protein